MSDDEEITQNDRPWPGRYFQVSEFACKDGTPYPERFIPLRLVPLVTRVLDPIREAWAGPLTVVSGYRTLSHNEAVGGAKASWHMEGMAADVMPAKQNEPLSVTVSRLWSMVRNMWSSGQLPELGGLGVYPGWIHVDIARPSDGHLRSWSGRGIGSEIV